MHMSFALTRGVSVINSLRFEAEKTGERNHAITVFSTLNRRQLRNCSAPPVSSPCNTKKSNLVLVIFEFSVTSSSRASHTKKTHRPTGTGVVGSAGAPPLGLGPDRPPPPPSYAEDAGSPPLHWPPPALLERAVPPPAVALTARRLALGVQRCALENNNGGGGVSQRAKQQEKQIPRGSLFLSN